MRFSHLCEGSSKNCSTSQKETLMCATGLDVFDITYRYGQDKPLTLSASLCFEQCDTGVEGDNASSMELYALLSRLANLPIRQDLAVTGSVNQWGEVQAIGGVNEKVEGFFDVCRVHGLTGTQGVLIPAANVRHLILRPDVIYAVGNTPLVALHNITALVRTITVGHFGLPVFTFMLGILRPTIVLERCHFGGFLRQRRPTFATHNWSAAEIGNNTFGTHPA